MSSLAPASVQADKNPMGPLHLQLCSCSQEFLPANWLARLARARPVGTRAPPAGWRARPPRPA
eukprot:3444411-Prorocentrum_lima.AAC.1